MNQLKLLFGIAVAATLFSTTVHAGAGGYRAVCDEPRLALVGTCTESRYDNDNNGKYDVAASLDLCFFEDGLWFYSPILVSCEEGEAHPIQAWNLIKTRNLEGYITSFAFRSENPELVDYNFGSRPTKKYTDFSKIPVQFKK